MTTGTIRYFDFEALRRTPLTREPFEFVVVPAFLTPEGRKALAESFPRIEGPGNVYLDKLVHGPGFEKFLEAIAAPEFSAACGEKFGVDLLGRARLVSARAFSGPTDGDIHTDHDDKIVTVLLYLNDAWEAEGGRLRLLRSRDNLDDVVAEVPPVAGTMLAFRRSDNSFHGHKRHVGPRRVVQINYLRDPEAARKRRRHWKAVSHAFKMMANRVRGINRH